MTDQTPVAAPARAPMSGENIMALSIAATCILGGMAAVAVFHADKDVVHGFCDPIIVGCAFIYQRTTP